MLTKAIQAIEHTIQSRSNPRRRFIATHSPRAAPSAGGAAGASPGARRLARAGPRLRCRQSSRQCEHRRDRYGAYQSSGAPPSAVSATRRSACGRLGAPSQAGAPRVRPALARKVESRSRFARSSRSISTACDRVLIAMAVRGPVPSDTDAVLGPGVGLSGVGIGLVPWVTASASPRPSNSAVSGTSVRVAPGPDL